MPPSSSPVLDAERRAWNYWFVDGLPNIIGGVGLLLVAATFEIDKKQSARNFLVAACCSFSFAAIMLRREQILDWLKLRVTYPRTGYVPSPYKRPTGLTKLRIDDPEPETPLDVRRARRNRALRSLPGIIAVGVALALLDAVNTPWVCLVAAALYGFAFGSATDRGIKHSLTIMLGMSFVGFGMSLLRVSGFQRVELLTAGAGLVLMTDGMITLIRYLRRNPVARA